MFQEGTTLAICQAQGAMPFISKIPDYWRPVLGKGLQAATHQTPSWIVFSFFLVWGRVGPHVQTCGLKLTEISRVTGSLPINGRLRLY